MKKRILCVCLALLLAASLLVGCNEDGEAKLLSFAEAQSIEQMKKYDGERVTIIGYMSTLSPVSGKFMYLMNLPYQSCPFCVPNTTILSNTMAVYAKDEFEFTDRAIRVTGVLNFGQYADEFGYEYSYRIKDATYEILDVSEMSEELKLWQQLASTDAVAKVYEMFDYLNFVCNWATYTANFEGGKDYVYPTDARDYLDVDGAQFNYGRKEGYFDGIIQMIEQVDPGAYAELVQVVRDAKELADQGYRELVAGKYTAVDEYSNIFKDGRKQYKMDESEMLENGMNTIYSRFSDWLASWEI